MAIDSVNNKIEYQRGAQEWTKIITDPMWGDISNVIMMEIAVEIWNPIWSQISDKMNEELSNHP